MFADHLGEIAALGTALCWAGSALFFEAAGQRIGSLCVNLLRLPIALVLLTLAGWLSRGIPLPVDATAEAWGYLALSGFIGFVLGDLCLFRAFIVLGPRRSSLLMSTTPIFTAVSGWLILGETLSGRHWAGMGLTIAGIAWALGERIPQASTRRVTAAGIFLALGGAVGQAGGLVVAKLGMADYSPIAATQIRVMTGFAGFAVLFAILGRWPHAMRALREKKAMGQVALGAAFGPFVGVSLSLLAVQHTSAGIAASIMATTPIVLIPIVVVLYREVVGLGGVLGTIIAVGGVALLFS